MSFWHRLENFSFKDLLAGVFCGFFLFFLFFGRLSEAQILVPLIGIILSFYFVSEGATLWLNRAQKTKEVNGDCERQRV